MKDSKLTIVIPCYNEEENIPVFFPKLLAFAQENSYRVIAVNDGSSDHTAEKLRAYEGISGYSVLTHKVNRGYGGAIKSGLSAAETEFAVTVDSDGQHRLEDVKRCADAIEEKNADLVVGARQNNESGSYRTLGKFMIRAFARSLLELPVKDLNSGMKCYRLTETRQYLELCPDTMAFSDVILLLMVNDRKLVCEIPIEVIPRSAGKSTIGTKTAFVTLTEILNLSILLRPLTTFCRLGSLFLILGGAWSIYTYVNSRSISSTAMTLNILGFFCFIFALLGEQISQIRKSLAKKESSR